MTTEELTPDQIDQLVGTRHAATGIEYPANGLQPYYHWLVRALHLLAESSAAALRVSRGSDEAMSVHVAPGRASIDDVALAYAGETLDLATFNNQTVYVWLYDDSGAATVGTAASGDGWPVTTHIKLAEITLDAGSITDVLDRRFETLFKV